MKTAILISLESPFSLKPIHKDHPAYEICILFSLSGLYIQGSLITLYFVLSQSQDSLMTSFLPTWPGSESVATSTSWLANSRATRPRNMPTCHSDQQRGFDREKMKLKYMGKSRLCGLYVAHILPSMVDFWMWINIRCVCILRIWFD